MKYRNKHYISTGSLPWIILPIVVMTMLATYLINDSFHSKPPAFYAMPRTNSVADSDDTPLDTPEFKTGDEALFKFTGDTVLVLGQPEPLAVSVEEVRVLRKRPNGNLEPADVPESWLVKLNGDTATAKPPAPLNDKLEQYKKRIGK